MTYRQSITPAAPQPCFPNKTQNQAEEKKEVTLGEWMDEEILCEVRKVERGMECKKSRESSSPQECPNLYGDQQTEGKGLCECIQLMET